MAWTALLAAASILAVHILCAAQNSQNAYFSGNGRQSDNFNFVGDDQINAGNIPRPFSASQGAANFGRFSGSGPIIGSGAAHFGPSGAAAAGGPVNVFGQDEPSLVSPAVILGGFVDNRISQGLGALQGNFADRFGRGDVSGPAFVVGTVERFDQGFGGPAVGGDAGFRGGFSGSRIALGGPIRGFGQGGPAGVLGGPILGGPAGVLGQGFGRGVVGQVNRVLEAPIAPTVTQTVTIDRYVTKTDTAFHSVPVTLTDLVVRTVTATTRQVLQTPVDDRVSLETTVLVRPTSVTVTVIKTDYRLVTDTLVDHVTVTHTSYRIKQATYTTTATQALTHTSTFVRTIVRTQRTTLTDYRTITDVAYAPSAYY